MRLQMRESHHVRGSPATAPLGARARAARSKAIALTAVTVLFGFVGVFIAWIGLIGILGFKSCVRGGCILGIGFALVVSSFFGPVLTRHYWRLYDAARRDHTLCADCGYNLLGNTSGSRYLPS